MVFNSAQESRRFHPVMNQQVQIAPTGLCSITKTSVPLKIINQGPEYFRQKLFPKEVADSHRPRRKSAVELLAESKPNYVKSASVLCHNQQLRGTRAQNTAGIRKKRHVLAERRMSAPGQLDKVTDNEQPIKSHNKCNHNNEYNKPTFLRPGIISQAVNKMRKSGDDNDIVMENDERQLSGRCPSSEYLDNCSMDVDVATLDNRLDWRDERICSVSDDDSIHGNHSGSHDLEDEAEAVVKPRLVQRSKSDSHRFSKTSSDFSDLEKISGNSADLERFFNEMGIERAVLDPMIKASVRKEEMPPQVFESLSSADSPDGRSGCSRGSKKHEEGLAMPDRTGGVVPQTSIVERNARIIKWLCNVKKARCKSTSD